MSNFIFEQTSLPGAVIIRPEKYGDSRGYFMETYHKEAFARGKITADFVQDNSSRSSLGVLRGLHFQRLRPQGKLVRVTLGCVFDVAVDLRPNSSAFGQWLGVVLSAEEGIEFYVPPGFAHGFLVMSEVAEFSYKCTEFYNPDDEGSIIYNDKNIGIEWPTIDTGYKLSDKDMTGNEFSSQNFKFYEGL